MGADRDDYMRRQEAEHDMIRMRDPNASAWAQRAAKAVGERAAQMTADPSVENAKLRAALTAVDHHVSHGKMGDWSIALTEIRKIVREALS